MEAEDHSAYVEQLKAEFDNCDSSSSGFLDKDDLTNLCQRLHLERHRPLLLDRLLGPHLHGQVNFEEFKEGFVAVLSRTLDHSSSEDSSYLEPEVKPKFIKGLKRYGRRSRPDSEPDYSSARDLDRDQAQDQSSGGVREAKLRKATSLESIESLKLDEEVALFPSRGVQQVHLEVGGVVMKGLLSSEEAYSLLQRLDPDVEGRVSLRDVHRVLCSPAPVCSSTPARPPPQDPSGSEERSCHCVSLSPLSPPGRQRGVLSEERSFRGSSSSLLTVGQRLLSVLDDGTGTVGPHQVLSLWREEGLQDGEEVLQMLDFSLDERLRLSELSLALDNELLVNASSIQQAALICYRTELQHLQTLVEQASRERDKLRADLDQADVRNMQLIREVDDRHNSLETTANNRIRDVELEYRERLSCLRTQMETETEVVLQQLDRERLELQQQLTELTTQETELQEELQSARQENLGLEVELLALKVKLRDSEASLEKLHQDLDQILLDKFSLDPSGAALSHDERFTELVREYELQCRELQDRNDELSSELDLVKSHRPETRKPRPGLSWNQDHLDQDPDREQTSDYDESETKDSSPRPRRKLTPQDKTALCSLDSGLDSGPGVSIQTELALEHIRLKHQEDMDRLRREHQEEVQQLNIDLETQVNYYKRGLEQMRRSMELERKDISQSFKMEICELEEQKSDLEIQLKQLRENMEQNQLRHTEQRTHEQEKRMQRERAEMEQNFAREISNLVQRLSSEKDQLEAELRLKMDQELLLVRAKAEEQLTSMKLNFSKTRRRLLRNLSLSRRREHEQRASWKKQDARHKENHQKHCGDIQILHKSLLQSETSFKTMTEQLNQSQEAVRRLKNQLKELQTVTVQSETTLQEVTEQFNQSNSLQQVKEQCFYINSQSETAKKHSIQLKEELKKQEAKIYQLQQNLQEALERCVESEKHLKDCEKKEIELQNENKELCRVNSQSETSLDKVREYSEQLEEELRTSRLRCSELEAQLDEACSHRILNRRLTEEKHAAESERDKTLKKTSKDVEEICGGLECLQNDRDRLILDLKNQAMAVDSLQVALEEEKTQRRNEREEAERLKSRLGENMELQSRLQTMQTSLEQEKKKLEEVQTSLERRNQEKERRMIAENKLEMQIKLKRDKNFELQSRVCELKTSLQQHRIEALPRNNVDDELRTALEKVQKLLQNSSLVDLDWERSRVCELEKREEQNEVSRLSLETSSYRRVVDQLSTQIMEMEEEIRVLRDHLGTVSAQLNETADLVPELRRQVNGKNAELEKIRDESERKLVHMEALVRRLEQEESRNTCRTQTEEVRSENSALLEQLSLLQQDVQTLEQEMDKKRRKLEEMERDQDRFREEQEKLHKENAGLREQVLDLSGRNLDLSSTNSELSTRIRSEQDAMVLLRDRLSSVSHLQEEEAQNGRRLKEELVQMEREKQQKLSSWNQEKHLLQTELTSARSKVGRAAELEAELNSVSLKLQFTENDHLRLRQSSETQDQQVEQLKTLLQSLEIEAECLRTQLQSTNQEALSHKQEVTHTLQRLQHAQEKVEDLESTLRKLMTEKEEVTSSMEAELQQQRIKNQELDYKVREVRAENQQIQKLNQEQVELQTQLDQLQSAKTEAQDQALRADTALSLVQAQHLRKLHQIQNQNQFKTRSTSADELQTLRNLLHEEQERREKLEQVLRVQDHEKDQDYSAKQEQYDKAMSVLQQRTDNLETQLKATRSLLQEKVQQLKDQMQCEAQSSLLLKQLYLENSELQGALQITEQRHKQAQNKIQALTRVLRGIVPHAIA